MNSNKIIKITFSVLICLGVGFLSSYPTRDNLINWYPHLIKPFFNPPNWVFAPVWTTLYVMIGIAFGIVWDKYSSKKISSKSVIYLFVLQLFLNGLWSILFFEFQNPFLAFIEIILLWFLINETIKEFNKVDDLAAKLLLPYMFWVSFAVVLNGSIWYLNR